MLATHSGPLQYNFGIFGKGRHSRNAYAVNILYKHMGDAFGIISLIN